jgi:hypothetical protein
MKILLKNAMIFSIAFLFTALPLQPADWFLDLETGLVTSGYNDVRIPNAAGTLFSLSEDLDIQNKAFYRIRAGVTLGDRHTISLFAAPLTLNADGVLPKDIFFFEEQFSAQTPVDGVFTFNSYRATYRYDFVRSDKWQVGIGFTAKIRDAEIRVESAEKSSSKTNVGFVPLLNFRIEYAAFPTVRILLEGDALASPGGQGRAEDVFLGLLFQASPHIDLKAGYRVVEGGADVDEVYNFAWINFYSVGAVIHF